MIGIYEGRYHGDRHGFNHHPFGSIDVVVSKKSQPVTLVLCSYEPVRWNVTLQPGAQVKQIILGGYHRQEVVGQGSTIPCLVHTYEATGAWGPHVRIQGEYFYAYRRPQNYKDSSDRSFYPDDPETRRAFQLHDEHERAEHAEAWRKVFDAIECAGYSSISTFQGNYSGSEFYI